MTGKGRAREWHCIYVRAYATMKMLERARKRVSNVRALIKSRR
jgi:hypothetical protein